MASDGKSNEEREMELRNAEFEREKRLIMEGDGRKRKRESI